MNTDNHLPRTFPSNSTFDPLRTMVADRDALHLRIRAEVRRLADLGIPEALIARETGLSRTTVRRAVGKN